ncbi:hypothetical protein G7Y79_00018g044270 [Physcia stellaris]|nr:hypothetical protein G7Y79_00018g044270 [Physcia stellaris]
MIAGIFFSFFRVCQLLTLIPAMGMLAYFVNIYNKANRLTPDYVLVLFIVSTLAVAWCLLTLIRRKSTRRSAHFVCFVDVCFIGALIAGVYYLRSIANANCTSFSNDGNASLTISTSGISGNNGFNLNTNKECAMLKASFAFGIMNIILFAITAFFLIFMKRQEKEVVVKETYRRRSHDSRRGHSRSGSGHHRSSRDSRRNYYV